MPTATLTSKGQITLPKKVREALDLEPGDQVDFVVQADGAVTLKAGRHDVRDLKGFLERKRPRPVSLAAMERAIARESAGR
jgi:AbrB family looped-hinge helix DNA binding protein